MWSVLGKAAKPRTDVKSWYIGNFTLAEQNSCCSDQVRFYNSVNCNSVKPLLLSSYCQLQSIFGLKCICQAVSPTSKSQSFSSRRIRSIPPINCWSMSKNAVNDSHTSVVIAVLTFAIHFRQKMYLPWVSAEVAFKNMFCTMQVKAIQIGWGVV